MVSDGNGRFAVRRIRDLLLAHEKAEISHFDVAGEGDEHVVGRERSVNDADLLVAKILLRMRVRKRRAHLDGEMDCMLDRQDGGPLVEGPNHAAQRLAMHVLHREVVAFFVFADIEGLRDVDVGELSGDAGLLEQFHDMPLILDERTT